ncbi:restriction endonuclease [Nocardia sp. NPDC004582]
MMARRRGFFAELQHQARLREQEQRRAELQQHKVAAQTEREEQRALKAAQRESAKTAREDRARHVERQKWRATHLTQAVRERVDALADLLAVHATTTSILSLDQLRQEFRPRPFVPDRSLMAATPVPTWEDFAPPTATGWSRMFPARYQQQVDHAQAEFREALVQHDHREQQRSAAWAAAADQHAADEAVRAEAINLLNARVDALENAVEAAVPTAVEECFETLLESTYLPADLPVDVEVAYQPEPQRLLVTRRLPGTDVIPAEREFRYSPANDEIVGVARAVKDFRQRYPSLLGQLVLLTMRDAFAVQPTTLVDEVAVNGVVAGRNRATGQPEDQCLISVSASREQFEGLVLAELNPVDCLRFLNAIVSPHPWDLEPVRPKFDPDLSRYKRDPSRIDVAATLDSRPVLLQMTPTEFEHLVRQLFEAMGMQSWVTQQSKDDGIDAVAVNYDPVMGGECIIQAKRYSKVVDIESVRALAGVMEDKHASRGVLVTTSWFGQASRDFADRHRRIQLIDGSELKYLIKEHLAKDVVPGVVKPSRRRGSTSAP